MKSLYLIRHGKSDWSHAWKTDFDRILSERWEKSVKKVGKFFKEHDIFPDIILSSPSVRTTLTATGIAQKIWFTKDIFYKREIYSSHVSGFEWALACIMELWESWDNVFFIWHNFAITQLAEYLSGETIGNIPTCWIVRIDFDVKNWFDIANMLGEKKYFIKVQDL